MVSKTILVRINPLVFMLAQAHTFILGFRARLARTTPLIVFSFVVARISLLVFKSTVARTALMVFRMILAHNSVLVFIR